jgi:hypothetical protein
MSDWIVVLLVWLVWLVLGIWYFLHNLGNKRRKDPWHSKFIMLPIWTIRFITYLSELSDRFSRK